MNQNQSAAFNVRCYESDNPTDQSPRVAIETDPNVDAVVADKGVAFHVAEGGNARTRRLGVAICGEGGDAETAGQGVAFANDTGNATTGDGGTAVSIGANATSSCESWGVAFSRSPTLETLGKVKGGPDSVLVLSWADGDDTHVRSIQVGTTNCTCAPIDSGSPRCDCTLILSGVWYTIDKSHTYRWVALS